MSADWVQVVISDWFAWNVAWFTWLTDNVGLGYNNSQEFNKDATWYAFIDDTLILRFKNESDATMFCLVWR